MLTGPVTIGSFGTNDLSRDGQIVIGTNGSVSSNTASAIMWTEAAGMQDLGALEEELNSSAFGISSNGEYIVGWSEIGTAENRTAFIWSDANGKVLIPSDGYHGSWGYEVSNDGTAVAGWVYTNDAGNPQQAAVWHEGRGWTLLGTSSSDEYQFTGGQAGLISDDGSIVVGQVPIPGSGFKSFIWTESTGTRDFREMLHNSYDLESELIDWTLFQVYGMSPDARFLVGTATNPSGNMEAFLVDLGAPIPEPTTGALALLALVGPFALRWRRR